MRTELLKRISERTIMACFVLALAAGTSRHTTASDISTVSFEELAEACTIPDRAYLTRSNHDLGSISTAFDPRNPEQHGQLTAVLTPQKWDRVFLPQPVETIYTSHNFGTKLEVIAQTSPDSAVVQLSLTEPETTTTINEAQAEIPLNKTPDETPITFCWTDGEIKFLKVDSEKTEDLVFTVAK